MTTEAKHELKEPTVEECLAELRRLFPLQRRIELGASFSPINRKTITCRVQVGTTLFMADTLDKCMAQVRAWHKEQ